jgi:hypothetical protein
VERYRRAWFLRGANADFAALRENSKAWKDEQAERGLWECYSNGWLRDE